MGGAGPGALAFPQSWGGHKDQCQKTKKRLFIRSPSTQPTFPACGTEAWPWHSYNWCQKAKATSEGHRAQESWESHTPQAVYPSLPEKGREWALSLASWPCYPLKDPHTGHVNQGSPRYMQEPGAGGSTEWSLWWETSRSRTGCWAAGLHVEVDPSSGSLWGQAQLPQGPAFNILSCPHIRGQQAQMPCPLQPLRSAFSACTGHGRLCRVQLQ